jgi:hypothetical protein
MKEAAVGKEAEAQVRDHYIRAPGQQFRVALDGPPSVERRTYDADESFFRLRILRTNSRHNIAAELRRKAVNHCPVRKALSRLTNQIPT